MCEGNPLPTIQHIHRNENAQYRITIERAASSTKNVIGYKVEANGDQMDLVVLDASILKARVEDMTKATDALNGVKEG